MESNHCQISNFDCCLKLFFILFYFISVEVGIEPTTFRLTAWRSNQLSYTTILLFSLVSTSALPLSYNGKLFVFGLCRRVVSIHRPLVLYLESEWLKENILTREGIEPPAYDLAIIALQLSYLVFTFVCLLFSFWFYFILENVCIAVWK